MILSENRFPLFGIISLANVDASAWPCPLQEPPQRPFRQRHAAGGRRKTRPRHVHEYRAATAGDARPGVVI
jgi:hypothetical protein